MRNSLIIVATCLLAALTACNWENDFYEVGRQPVFLTHPAQDTVLVLDKQKPDTLYRFTWTSKRPYMQYKLVLSTNEALIAPREDVPTGIKMTYYLSARQIDALLDAMGFSLGERCPVWWSVDVEDPEAGWCDERRTMTVTRFDELPGE